MIYPQQIAQQIASEVFESLDDDSMFWATRGYKSDFFGRLSDGHNCPVVLFFEYSVVSETFGSFLSYSGHYGALRRELRA